MKFLDMVGIAAKEFDCTVDEIMSPVSRKHGPRHICDARAALQYYLRKVRLWTLQRIANQFSLKSHTTIVKNINKLNEWEIYALPVELSRMKIIARTIQKLKQAYDQQSETTIHGA